MLGSYSRLGSRAIHSRKGRSRSVVALAVPSSFSATDVTSGPSTAMSWPGGVLTVSDPPENWRSAVATAAKTVGFSSVARSSRRFWTRSVRRLFSPVNRAAHIRSDGSEASAASSSTASSARPELKSVHRAASRASSGPWVFIRAKSAAFCEAMSGRPERIRWAMRRCQTLECARVWTSSAVLRSDKARPAGRGGTGRPGWSPVQTMRQMRPRSRSTPSGSAPAFW